MKYLLIILSIISAQNSFAEGVLDMKLLKAVFDYNLCVRTSLDIELGKLNPKKPEELKKGAEFEGDIWDKVFSRCVSKLGDEQKGLVLLHYQGDGGKAMAFLDGTIYSSRAYVVSRCIQYQDENGLIDD